MIVRIDLDRYDLDVVERLVVDGIIDVAEAKEHYLIVKMSEFERLMWVRKMMSRMRMVG